MNNYEVTDAYEVGEAAVLIRDKEYPTPDEIAGFPGPAVEDIDSD
jgi:hypothetical protein